MCKAYASVQLNEEEWGFLRNKAAVGKTAPNVFWRKMFCRFFFCCVVVLTNVRCMQSHRCSSFLHHCKMNIIIITQPIQILIRKNIFCILFKLFFSHIPTLIFALCLHYTFPQKCYTWYSRKRLFKARRITANSQKHKHCYLQYCNTTQCAYSSEHMLSFWIGLMFW